MVTIDWSKGEVELCFHFRFKSLDFSFFYMIHIYDFIIDFRFLYLSYPTPRIALFVRPSVTKKYRIIYSQSILYSQCKMRVSPGLSARGARRTSQEGPRENF